MRVFIIPFPRGSPHNMNIQHLSCFSTEFHTLTQTHYQVYINFHIYFLNVMGRFVACVWIVGLPFLPDPLKLTLVGPARGTYAVRTRIYIPGGTPRHCAHCLSRCVFSIYFRRGEEGLAMRRIGVNGAETPCHIPHHPFFIY